ncbi:MAG TPA: glycosyltransferase family 2 protein [Candidatus Nanopelagicales bacterium]
MNEHDDEATRPALMRRPDPRVSIVIPAKNEARNLPVVLPGLPPVHEVILVDGDSTDGTPAVARQVLPGIRILQQTRRGKGNALAVGFAHATGDIIVMFDADGSNDPGEIPAFVAALVDGADFAKGSRRLKTGGSDDITGIRNLGNVALLHTANLLFNTRFTDLCYGFNAFWRDVLPAFELPPIEHAGPLRARGMLWGDGFEIETLLNCRAATADLRIVEVPSLELPRIHGTSNLNARTDGMRVLRTLVAERRAQATSTRSGAYPASAPLPLHRDEVHAGGQQSAAPDEEEFELADILALEGEAVRPRDSSGHPVRPDPLVVWGAFDHGGSMDEDDDAARESA